jgi:hypothetical protein
MGVQLGKVKPRRSRRRSDVLPAGRVLPELNATEPAKTVPFQVGANKPSPHKMRFSRRGGYDSLKRIKERGRALPRVQKGMNLKAVDCLLKAHEDA